MRKLFFLLSSVMLLAAFPVFAGVPQKAKPSKAPSGLRRTESRITAPVKAAPAMPLLNRTLGSGSAASKFTPHSAPAMQKAPAKVLGDGTTIYGGLVYTSAWAAGSDYGLYSFPAAEYQTPQKVYSSYEANGGGCYAEGKYYFNSYVYTDEMGYTFSTFCVMDLATGETSKTIHSFINEGFNQSMITNGMAYDPTSGRMYALSYIAVELVEGALEKYYPAISEIDMYSGQTAPIARIPSMVALAINQSGEMYGISMGDDAVLYRINKETGDYTEIGSTGRSSRYVQSATFDPITGKLYWAAVSAKGECALYEVNTSTGAAELITTFLNHEEYGSLFIPVPEVADKAPAPVADLKGEFAGDNHSGTISFTAPSKASDGSVLSGSLNVSLSVDGAETLAKTCAPGEKISTEVTLTEGIHGFVAYASNDAGRGANVGASVYVGMDAPAAVGNLKAIPDEDHNAVITWDVPAKGRNDGYIDPAQITYTVKRMPDEVTVASGLTATAFTDRSMGASANFYYVVTPWIGIREGVAAQTDEALFGSGTSLPCRFSFDTREDYDLFTVIDANNDWEAQYHWGGWMYSPEFSYANSDTPAAVYGYNPMEAADDWLISPPFTAKNGTKYKVSFLTKISSDPETLTVTAGIDNTVAAQTITVVPQAQYTNKDYAEYSGEFVATRDGNCFIGFHVTSKKKAGYLYIDNIEIDEVPDAQGPKAVTNLEVVPAEEGALVATIAFTSPSESIDGSTLTALSKINVYRGNDTEPIYTFVSPRMGVALDWDDEAPVNGWNEYRVVAYNQDNVAGAAARATAFVGHDTALAPTNVTLSEENGAPVIRWTAPAGGQNGGYVDMDNLKYAIYRYDGEQTSLITSSATGTQYIDTGIDGKEKQYLLIYELIPVSQGGVGDYAVSNYIVFGDPYAGPFFESFSDQYSQNDPWVMQIVKGRQQLWGLASAGSSPVCNPVDGDYGLAVFGSTYGYVGDAGRLISPKIDLNSMNSPVLTFYFYHSPSYDSVEYGEDPYQDRLIVEALTPAGDFVELTQPIYVDDPSATSAWYEYQLPLASLKEYGWVRLSFQGISDSSNDIAIDAIGVSNIEEHDLSIYTFSGPSSVRADRKALYSATVYNNGLNAASGYSVALLRNGVEVNRIEAEGSLEPGAYAEFSFEVMMQLADEGKEYKYEAQIEWDLDAVDDNNISEPVFTTVTGPAYPEVYKLAADVDADDVQLSWSQADALHVAEDFESYPAFSVSNIGDFSLFDGDKGYTYGFTDIYFPHTGEPGSYMVFNPDAIGVSMLEEWRAFSGSQCLAAFSAYSTTTGSSIANDDWLISPEVHGGQKISFYVKTANQEWGLETFRVYYSTSSPNPGTMVSQWEEVEAPQEWTLVTLTLPEDARYFAIVCTSLDKFVFYIDDISYVAKANASAYGLTGYRVYRDGVALADLAADSRAYLDENVADGEHVYAVRALYGEKESGDSDLAKVLIGQSGLNEAMSEAVIVSGGIGRIIVSGETDDAMTLTDAAGTVIYDGAAVSIPAARGIYLVKIGTARAAKVLVR